MFLGSGSARNVSDQQLDLWTATPTPNSLVNPLLYLL